MGNHHSTVECLGLKSFPTSAEVGIHRMRRLRILAYTTVAATYVLIIIGGYVSASGSGLACPDWPTCNGQILPALTGHVLVEYTHRLMAVLVSLLVTATWLVIALRYKRERNIFIVSTMGLILLFAQVLLGMVTVRTDLNPFVTAGHLGLASGVFALVLVNAFMVRGRSKELVRQFLLTG
jgi:heme a synthase